MHSMRDIADLVFLVPRDKPMLPRRGPCHKHVTMTRATRRLPTVHWESRAEERQGGGRTLGGSHV